MPNLLYAFQDSPRRLLVSIDIARLRAFNALALLVVQRMLTLHFHYPVVPIVRMLTQISSPMIMNQISPQRVTYVTIVEGLWMLLWGSRCPFLRIGLIPCLSLIIKEVEIKGLLALPHIDGVAAHTARCPTIVVPELFSCVTAVGRSSEVFFSLKI